jgi:hypothetical protein
MTEDEWKLQVQKSKEEEETWLTKARQCKAEAAKLRLDAKYITDKAIAQDKEAATYEMYAKMTHKPAPTPTAEKQKRDLAFLKSFDRWTEYPFIALSKTKTGERAQQVTLHTKSVPGAYTLYAEPIVELKKIIRRDGTTASGAINTKEVKSYGSLEAIIADGWEISGADVLVLEHGR